MALDLCDTNTLVDINILFTSTILIGLSGCKFRPFYALFSIKILLEMLWINHMSILHAANLPTNYRLNRPNSFKWT